MKKLITEIIDNGICVVDIDKVIKTCDDRYLISKSLIGYELLRHESIGNYAKITISKEQAEILISKLNLLPIKSVMTKNVTSYRTESGILHERKRVKKLLEYNKGKLEYYKNMTETIECIIDELNIAME